MPVPPVNSASGVGPDRTPAAADAAAELQRRRMEKARESKEAKEAPPEEPARTPVAESARKEEIRPYRVSLDPETSRLTTEVVDTETGRVLLRIPPRAVFTMPEPDPTDGSGTGAAAAKDDGDILL